MRHQKAGRKLGRTSSHRRALLRNLTTALIEKGRIRTTEAKAKELRSVAERMVTIAKQGTLAARRRAYDRLRNRAAVQKLFDELGPRFASRAGGYTRVVKLGTRKGDAAALAMIEFIDDAPKPAPKKGAKPPKKAAA